MRKMASMLLCSIVAVMCLSGCWGKKTAEELSGEADKRVSRMENRMSDLESATNNIGKDVDQIGKNVTELTNNAAADRQKMTDAMDRMTSATNAANLLTVKNAKETICDPTASCPLSSPPIVIARPPKPVTAEEALRVAEKAQRSTDHLYRTLIQKHSPTLTEEEITALLNDGDWDTEDAVVNDLATR